MQCRNCGAEIADKALICYRCGTPTTEAKYKPAQQRKRSPGWTTPLVISVLFVAVLILLLLYLRGALD